VQLAERVEQALARRRYRRAGRLLVLEGLVFVAIIRVEVVRVEVVPHTDERRFAPLGNRSLGRTTCPSSRRRHVLDPSLVGELQREPVSVCGDDDARMELCCLAAGVARACGGADVHQGERADPSFGREKRRF
jgi:hypothetical protein